MRLEEQTFNDLLGSIAAKTPTPGGGAVASITGALAAALAQMVVNYSVGKKSLNAHDDLHRESLKSLSQLASRALDLADADAEAYARMNEVWKLDAADPRRQRDLPAAVEQAIAPPSEVLTVALEMLGLLRELTGKTNANLNSDLAIAAVLADAAAQAAAWNVQINLPMLTDQAKRDQIASDVEHRLSQCRSLCTQIEQSCRAAM